MKTINSFFTLFLLVITCSLTAQPGWTLYNHTNTILGDDYYRTISIDQSGNIWTGGSYTGLFKFNGTTWSKYSTSNTNLLSDDINKILIDNSNKVWVGNYKGISVFNGTNFTNYDTTNAAFNGLTVYALRKDNNGKIWLSSRNASFGYEGITTFDGTTWTNLSGYPSQTIGREFKDFVFTASNEAWIACEVGILKYSGSTFTFYPKASTGLWSSTAVTIDGSANIWAGGYDGLLKYNGSTWKYFDNVADLGLTSNSPYNDILADGNILWIANYGGLLKFDRITGEILAKYNETNSPLSANGVKQIAKDASGNLWLATNTGIIKMNPALVGVGVGEQNNKKQFSIYPNPSTGIYNISFEGQENISYKIYSTNGKIISEGTTISNNFQVSLVDVPSGVYFMHVISNNFVNKVVKLVKN